MEYENQILEKIDLIAIIRRVWKYLRKVWILVLVLTLLGSSVMYLRARANFTPYYESKALLSVKSGFSSSIFVNTYYSDNVAASQVADSFPSLLGTDIMRDLIKNHIGKSVINGTISANSIANTNLFELKVRSRDPQDAYDILIAVIDCYPQVAVYSLDNPELVIRQDPIIPTNPANHFSGSGPALKGALTGMAFGLLFAVIPALISKTVMDSSELKKLVNLPLLVSFPHVNQKKRRKGTDVFIKTSDSRGFSEAMRGLRTKVHKQLWENQGKIVLLTSTLPNEGKSTISANLALALTDEGHKAVLVDADLRNQSIHRMFNKRPNRKNLMDFMQNEKLDILDSLQTVPGTNLAYLSGRSIQNRHYGIESRALKRVLDVLATEYDYIILDSPPTGIVSDTGLIARMADCVLYVVKQDHASQGQILDCISSLHSRNIPLTGCILNDVPRRSAVYGYGYG